MAALAAASWSAALAGAGSAGASPPYEVSVPRLWGLGAVGQELHCDPGTWWEAGPGHGQGLGTVRVDVRWLRGSKIVSGADSATYRVGPADRGHWLRCQATASDSGGSRSARTRPLWVYWALPTHQQLSWRRIARFGNDSCSDGGKWTSGPYALFTLDCSHLLLRDDLHRTSQLLDRCVDSDTILAFGAPWIVWGCNGAPALYNVRTRYWRPISCRTTACRQAVANTDVFRVGAHWIELEVNLHQDCGDPEHHPQCGSQLEYYNIDTGTFRARLPAAVNAVVDLDSPKLTRPLCRPLTQSDYGIVSFDGRFAVAADSRGLFLERCGTHLHLPIDPDDDPAQLNGLMLSSRALSWPVLDLTGGWDGQLPVVFIPSLRLATFSAPPSVPVDNLNSPALDNYRVYVDDGDGYLWAAWLPCPVKGSATPCAGP